MNDTTRSLVANREVTDQIELTHDTGPVALVPSTTGQALELAKLMAGSGVAVPVHLRQNPGMCMRVGLRAWSSALDPYELADQSFVIEDKRSNKKLCYTAQAIHAIAQRNPVITSRFSYAYSGEGDTLRCTVTARIGGSLLLGDGIDEVYESPPFGQIGIKNSPLWREDPRQQLGYLAVRRWCRRHAPDAILGLYTPEEISHGADAETAMVQGTAVVVEPAGSDADQVAARLGVGPPSAPADQHPYEVNMREEIPKHETAESLNVLQDEEAERLEECRADDPGAAARIDALYKTRFAELEGMENGPESGEPVMPP